MVETPSWRHPDRKAALLILVYPSDAQPRVESPCPRDSFQRASIHSMHRTLISSLLLLVGLDPLGVLQGWLAKGGGFEEGGVFAF